MGCGGIPKSRGNLSGTFLIYIESNYGHFEGKKRLHDVATEPIKAYKDMIKTCSIKHTLLVGSLLLEPPLGAVGKRPEPP